MTFLARKRVLKMVDFLKEAKRLLRQGDKRGAMICLEALEEETEEKKGEKAEMYKEHIEHELDTLADHIRKGKDAKEIHDYLKDRKADYKEIEHAIDDKFWEDLSDEDIQYILGRIKEVQSLLVSKNITVDDAFSKTWRDLAQKLALKVGGKKALGAATDDDDEDDDEGDDDTDADDDDDEDDEDDDAPKKSAKSVPIDKKVKAILGKK